MVDVFISYSRDNQDAVRRIAEAVKREGYAVWWDDELPPHLSYGDVITEKIGAAKAAIVVWSQSSARSEWVRAEADVARNQKKLIQTSIDGRMPPMPFNQIQFASIGDWNGEDDHPGWRKVKASLTALCGPPAAATRGTPAPPHMSQRHTAFTPAGPAPASPNRPQWLLIAAIAASVLVIMVVIALTLLRGPAPTSTAEKGTAAPSELERKRSVASAEPRAARAAPQPESGESAPDNGEGGPPQVIPDSSIRQLTTADVQNLSPGQIRIARNEIYARRGRIFRDPALRAHFARYSWYRPVADEVELSPIETANVNLLQEAEAW